MMNKVAFCGNCNEETRERKHEFPHKNAASIIIGNRVVRWKELNVHSQLIVSGASTLFIMTLLLSGGME